MVPINRVETISDKNNKVLSTDHKYVFYKAHRDVLIWAIASSTYSYSNAVEIVKKVMDAFDEEVMTIFKQYKIPKGLPEPQLRRLSNLSRKIKQILEEENKISTVFPMLTRKKSKQGEKIMMKSEKNMMQVA